MTPLGEATVVFEGARLIVGDASPPIEDAVLVVTGDRIARVGARDEVEVPEGAAKVDLSGKTVMPALVSTHMHVGLLDGMSFETENFTREMIVEHLERYAYYGLGAVLSAGTDVGSLAFEVRDAMPSGAARLLTAGRGMAAPNAGPGFPAIASTSFPITSADEGRERVRELAERGADAVKIWVDDRNGRVEKLTPDIYGPIIEEAHAHGLKAVAHVYYLTDARELVEAGIDGFMHPVRDEVMDDALVAAMKERNVFLAANMGGTRRSSLTGLPQETIDFLSETVPETILCEYEAGFEGREPEALASRAATYAKMEESVRKLNAAGVPVVLGGDTGIPGAWHGWADHYELECMVGAGMTPAEAILGATSAPAAILGLDDLGTLSEGKSASFLVLDANPLEDIRNTRRIADVYLRGERLDRAALRNRWTSQPSR